MQHFFAFFIFILISNTAISDEKRDSDMELVTRLLAHAEKNPPQPTTVKDIVDTYEHEDEYTRWFTINYVSGLADATYYMCTGKVLSRVNDMPLSIYHYFQSQPEWQNKPVLAVWAVKKYISDRFGCH